MGAMVIGVNVNPVFAKDYVHFLLDLKKLPFVN